MRSPNMKAVQIAALATKAGVWTAGDGLQFIKEAREMPDAEVGEWERLVKDAVFETAGG